MPLAERTAHVTWTGTLASGDGAITTGSGAGGALPLDWASRSEAADGTTSPEELLAAAHASCYATTLALLLSRRGQEPERIGVDARCELETAGDWYRVTRVTLAVDAAGVDEDTLREADRGCAISNALRGDVEIVVSAAATA